MKIHPGQDIQRVLDGLRDTAPPTGLEARIAQRLHTATQARPTFFAAIRPSFFAVILNAVKDPRISPVAATGYAFAATAVLAITLTALHLHRNDAVAANIPHRATPLSFTTPHTLPAIRSPRRQHSHPQPHPSAPVCGCDETALAETFAPSHPAPPMPLTPQERLLLLATRRGAPIEVAELDQLREPLLRAAEAAREHDNLRQYIRGLLSPLAAAKALDPTSTPPANDPPPTPEAPDPNQP